MYAESNGDDFYFNLDQRSLEPWKENPGCFFQKPSSVLLHAILSPRLMVISSDTKIPLSTLRSGIKKFTPMWMETVDKNLRPDSHLRTMGWHAEVIFNCSLGEGCSRAKLV